ncbi:hypothetical protein Pint_07648 [Pistacia integerrima]|uniref:Uncharacterized protein n=1 Tax=Pistacia integerrima TaxID=434235 RepID=A0ACC0XYE7_9ROSI|nr:hypothetical protein Pint_07648 [Pistacia integerrima]
MFVKGKELWGHLDGFSKAPTDPKELSLWESKDAKIASWLLNSIEPHMVNNLRGFTTVKAMWNYRRRIYYQDNSARKFQLELDIGNYRQGNLSIEQFYSGFIDLWSDYSGLVQSQVPEAALVALQTVHSESQQDQFLMKLRPEFESLGLDQDIGGSEMVNMAYATQVCFCAYIFPLPVVPSSSSNITPKQVQQMIIYALSALGLQGKTHLLTSPWLIDSAASNHMSGSLTALQDVRKYDGEQHIQIVDGSSLPITAVGNLGSSFTNVFVSPDLSANLISIGQLVEDNCSIHFDHSGCHV